MESSNNAKAKTRTDSQTQPTQPTSTPEPLDPCLMCGVACTGGYCSRGCSQADTQQLDALTDYADFIS